MRTHRQHAIVLGVLLSGAALAGTQFHAQAKESRGTVQKPAPVKADAARKSTAKRGGAPLTHLDQSLAFELNQGQVDSKVKFMARGAGYQLFLNGRDAMLAIFEPRKKPLNPATSTAEEIHRRGVGVQVSLAGSNAAPAVRGEGLLPAKTNYLIGSDAGKWQRNIPNFSRVRYESVYPNIDLVYYGNNKTLEFDFVAAPGADPNQIRLNFAGADSVKVGAGGELVLQTSVGQLHLGRPVVYQESEGVRRPISGGYRMLASRSKSGLPEVGFRLGNYDRTRKLVIDPPAMIYATYAGNGFDERGVAITHNSAGEAFAFLNTSGTSSLATPGAFKTTADHMLLRKYSTTGSLLASTYLGGSNNSEIASGITIDAMGNPVVVGSTQSGGAPTAGAYPTTAGAFQRERDQPWDGFITKLNTSLTGLVYSTYIGGRNDDRALAVSVDSTGTFAYVAGRTISDNFPYLRTFGTTGAGKPRDGHDLTLGGGYDGFLIKIKMDPAQNGTSVATSFSGIFSDPADLFYVTYLGGTQADECLGVSNDDAGLAWVTGDTFSTRANGFPVAPFPGAYQTDKAGIAGVEDVFVTKYDTTVAGTGSLVFSTYVGGSQSDVAKGIDVDDSGNSYLTGYTKSNGAVAPAYPTTAGLTTTYRGGMQDAFVSKLNPTGTSLVYSTFLGGSDTDDATGIVADIIGNTYITGYTASSNFPQRRNTNIQMGYNGNTDMFVTKLRPNGSGPVFSSFLGGNNSDIGSAISVDQDGNAYVTGHTTNTTPPGFPVVNAAQPTYGGGPYDGIVIKFDLNDPPTIMCPETLAAGCGSPASFSVDVADPDGDQLRVTFKVDGVTKQVTDVPGTDPTTMATVNFSYTYPPGSHTVTVEVTDGLAPQTCTVMVTSTDGTAPSITCPSDKEANNDPGTCFAEVEVGTPTVMDNCDPSPSVVGVRSDGEALTALYPVGTTMITWTAMDASGNMNSCVQAVNVYDVEAPVFVTCPPDVCVDATPGAASAMVNPGFPEVTDNCEVIVEGFRDNADDPDVPITAAASRPFPLGDTVILWIAVDPSLNFEVCFTTVHVSGNTDIVSSFDADAESWTVVGGNGTGPTYSGTGGNPNGHIAGADAFTASIPWYFNAPSKFLGNKQYAYNQNLTFDLKQNATTPVLSDSADVIIEGANLRLRVALSGPPGTGWTSYTVNFSTSSAWYDDATGLPATDDQIQQVLGELISLRIRGKYNLASGNTAALDNVKMPLVVLPCP